MTTPRYLTKSRFKQAVECPTKLYYSGNPTEYKDNMADNTFLAMLAEGGYQVGALAKLRYPSGIEIEDRNHAAAYAKTLEYLAQDNVVLFEPAILFGDFFIRIDILVKKGNRFELIEVKAKLYDSLNPEIEGARGGIKSGMLAYIQDVAFQKWVLQQAFPSADITTFLMMPDKNKVTDVDGLNQMFKITERSTVLLNIPADVDVQSIAENLLAKVSMDKYVAQILEAPLAYPGGESAFGDVAKRWAEAYKKDVKIAPVIGAQCGGCQFKAPIGDELKSGFHECWKQANHWTDQDFENGTVLDLWNFKKKQQLIDKGIYKISQISRHDIGDFDDAPELTGLSRKQRQWLQVGGIPNDYDYGGFYFDNNLVQVKMSHWHYPYHLIDFETSAVALPFYAGMRPYEQIAFQFSHHVMKADGTVSHVGEFLCAEPGEFPNYAFARALKAELEHDHGSVFMWSHHENTILSAIVRQLSEESTPPADAESLKAFLLTLIKNGERAMIDLCTLAEKSFFHPDTKGGNSIKQVLPAVLKVSSFLKQTYSQPIYGKPGGIPSKNFSSLEGIAWIEPAADGGVINPYARLKQLAKDNMPDGGLVADNQASVIADGGAALAAYSRLQFEDMSDEARQRIKSALLRYCEVDTLAMVMIVQAWQALNS